MKTFCLRIFTALLMATAYAADPLPSWNDTGPKQAIIPFDEKATKEVSVNEDWKTIYPLANK